MRLLVLCLTSVACVFAQSYAGPRCEPAPELKKRIPEIWHDTSHRAPELFTWQAAEWERLLEQHPRETVLHRRYYLLFRDAMPDRVGDLRARYQRRAEENPKDVLAVYMAGLVLEGADTPKAIATLERAARLDPGFGWSHLTLAYLYGRGKFQDKQKASESVAAYFQACPQNAEDFSLSMLNQYGTPEVMAAHAKRLRDRLATESDAETLRAYSNLWGLEFKGTPVAEHPAQRERVAADLRRLEKLNVTVTPEWLAFLGTAMKQCGRIKEVAGIEDRITAEFPKSGEALQIALRRLEATDPEPKDGARTDEWNEYGNRRIAALEGLLTRFPSQESNLVSMMLDEAVVLRPPDLQRIRDLGERMLRASDARGGPRSWPRISIADRAYLRNGVDPKRAMELLESARPLMRKENARELAHDGLTDRDRQELIAWQRETELTWVSALATAYRRAGVGERAEGLRSVVEGREEAKPDLRWQRFAALADIAAALGKHVDALVFYQAALDARPKAPRPVRGRIEDPFLSRAREVWELSGGSEEAWRLWSKPTERAGRTISDASWEQPGKPLPPFELTDVGGRKWTSKALEGRTLFINVWSTWCGPCVAELPHFQTLYEQTKARSDLAVFSLNVDDEVGLVQPFLKEKGWTFPTLLAASYVNRTVDTLAVPQTWIVNGKGIWLWQQLGYDGDPDWVRSMLAKIEAVK